MLFVGDTFLKSKVDLKLNDDYIVLNFECVIGQSEEIGLNKVNLSSDINFISCLKGNGRILVNLANNHSLDYGRKVEQ